MREKLALMASVAAALAGCATVDVDRSTLALPTAVRTQVSFEPLDREKAARYLEVERHVHRENTEALRAEIAGLEAGRKERYDEIAKEFPECGRQRHCQSKLSLGSVKRFERFNDLAKELNDYDRRLVELQASLDEWGRRLELRTRAILNRFLVHEVLQIPQQESRFQAILAYSLESFDTRRQLSRGLLRYGGEGRIEPALVGDLNFRMHGQPVDEAAVLATFEVYLQPLYHEPDMPTRYVVTMLVNTHQLDLRYYDKDFLRKWGAKLVEPFQEELRKQVFCGVYSIASDTLAPRLGGGGRSNQCAAQRAKTQPALAPGFAERFSAAAWMMPVAYYPLARVRDLRN